VKRTAALIPRRGSATCRPKVTTKVALAGVALLASTGFGLGVASLPASATPNPVQLFTSSTQGSYPVTVPPGVTSISVTAVGGTGAPSPDWGGSGGRGAVVTTTATVTPGESLTVTVAGNGAGLTGGFGAGSGGSAFDTSDGDGGGGGGHPRYSAVPIPWWLPVVAAVPARSSRPLAVMRIPTPREAPMAQQPVVAAGQEVS